MASWERAWRAACRAARPGARVAVADLGLPTGRAAVLWPLARLACAAGSADPRRDPGRAVLRDTRDGTRTVLRGGHVVVTAGTLTDAGPRQGGLRPQWRSPGAAGAS